MQNLTS